jgi:hypothetical protein
LLITDPTGNSAIPREWMNDLVTLSEIEGPGRAPDLIAPVDGPEWRAFKEKIGEHDELRYFTSPPESFIHGGGRMGYVIVRDGRQVAAFVAMMS